MSNKDDIKNSELVFPDTGKFTIKTMAISLTEIIRSSEEMLPFENRRRKPSDAVSFTPFVLK